MHAVAAAKTAGPAVASVAVVLDAEVASAVSGGASGVQADTRGMDTQRLRTELLSIRDLLSP
jgi:hypothetical protein